jgi:hypothetical protein
MLPLQYLSVIVLVLHGDRLVARDLDHQVREGHAIVPHGERLAAPVRDFRIDHEEGTLAEVTRDHATRMTNLWCANGTSISVLIPEGFELLAESVQFELYDWIAHVLNWMCFLLQYGIAQ